MLGRGRFTKQIGVGVVLLLGLSSCLFGATSPSGTNSSGIGLTGSSIQNGIQPTESSAPTESSTDLPEAGGPDVTPVIRLGDPDNGSMGTIVGNPSLDRFLIGSLPDVPESQNTSLNHIATPGVSKKGDLPLQDPLIKPLCQTSQPMDVVATGSNGDVVSQTVRPGGEFRVPLKANQTYRVQFTQNNQVCYRLVHGKEQSTVPYYSVAIGKGLASKELRLGRLAVQSDMMVTSVDPTTQTDEDNDGISDAKDNDVDGDGINDSDEDLNGVMDWSEAKPAIEHHQVCHVKQFYPYNKSFVKLDKQGFADLYFRLSIRSKALKPKMIKIYQNVGGEWKPAEDIKVLGLKIDTFYEYSSVKGKKVLRKVGHYTIQGLKPKNRYGLEIKQGAITCSDDGDSQYGYRVEFKVRKK